MGLGVYNDIKVQKKKQQKNASYILGIYMDSDG